jgi:mono/diheme cytochrome c family protein
MKQSIFASFVLLAAAIVVACGDPAATGRVADIGGLTGDATAGAALYETHCLACHGQDACSGSAGENLVRNVTEEQDEFGVVILDGKDNGAMPAFADTLGDREIADILAYIGSL